MTSRRGGGPHGPEELPLILLPALLLTWKISLIITIIIRRNSVLIIVITIIVIILMMIIIIMAHCQAILKGKWGPGLGTSYQSIM